VLLIAVTPTYQTIGIAAPAILALARIIEGLSLGGEYGASATYLSEVADPRHRGFYSSFQYVTLIGGQLTAIMVLLLLQKVFLTPEELKDWGWRIPFVIGAGLAIFAAVMRRSLQETDAFVEAKKVSNPTGSIRRLLNYPRELLLVVGLTAGGTAAFQRLDVIDAGDVRAFVSAVGERYGRVDVVVNNAGVMPLSPLEALKTDEWDRMIDVNVRGVLVSPPPCPRCALRAADTS